MRDTLERPDRDEIPRNPGGTPPGKRNPTRKPEEPRRNPTMEEEAREENPRNTGGTPAGPGRPALPSGPHRFSTRLSVLMPVRLARSQATLTCKRCKSLP